MVDARSGWLALDLWGPVESASYKAGSAGRVTVTLAKAPLNWKVRQRVDEDEDEYDKDSFEVPDSDESLHEYSGRWPGPIVKGSQRGKVWEAMQGQLEREQEAKEEAEKKVIEER